MIIDVSMSEEYMEVNIKENENTDYGNDYYNTDMKKKRLI